MAEVQGLTLEDIIENITKVATELQPTKQMQKKKKNGVETETEVVKAADPLPALISLRKCVEDLASLVKKDCADQADHAKKAIEQEDEIDHLKQKSLKGKIIITSKIKEGDGSIKTAAKIKEEGGTLVAHVQHLVKHKYNVDITEDDIASCFHLPKGGILVTFWKKWKGSPFQNLVAAIKSPTNSKIPLYFNFMLTKRRSQLLFEVRNLKKAGRIFKFFSDEEGCIAIKEKKGGKNTKITDIAMEGSAKLRTWAVEDLLHAFPVSVNSD
jgi:hypothetical protein